MKKITTTILLAIIAIATYAQPNITKNIVVKDSKCENVDASVISYLEYGNKIYAVGFGWNGPNTFSDASFIICNSNFDTIKTIRYGGSKDDCLRFIDKLPNGNLLLSGYSNSKDGDLQGIGHLYASNEVWLMEVDTNGVIIKQRTLSGSGHSGSTKPIISSDGYIYVGGSTFTKDHDFAHTSNYGMWDEDPYYCKLDTAFTIKWMKIITTSTSDVVIGITEINANKFIINIQVEDTLAELLGTDKKGNGDFLIFCVDSNNNVYWKHRYGGAGVNYIQDIFYDDSLAKLICGGSTTSSAGDIGYHTSKIFQPPLLITNCNAWVMILDTLGNIIHSKAYGSVSGDFYEYPLYSYYHHQIWVNARYINANGDFTNNVVPISDTFHDLWLAIIDINANLLGSTVYKVDQGAFKDIGLGFYFIAHNNLYFASFVDYDDHSTITCGTRKSFGFILNLSDAPLAINNYGKKVNNLFELYPNPTQNEIQIKLLQQNGNDKYAITVFDNNGKQVYATNSNINTSIPCAIWASGKYIITLSTATKQQTLFFIKQ